LGLTLSSTFGAGPFPPSVSGNPALLVGIFLPSFPRPISTAPGLGFNLTRSSTHPRKTARHWSRGRVLIPPFPPPLPSLDSVLGHRFFLLIHLSTPPPLLKSPSGRPSEPVAVYLFFLFRPGNASRDPWSVRVSYPGRCRVFPFLALVRFFLFSAS